VFSTQLLELDISSLHFLSTGHPEDPKMQLLALTLLAASAVVTANEKAWVTYFDNLVTFGDRLGNTIQ
jgi:uncharacterized membrane protein